jgi:uncharacterized protein (TIGR00730 family)
MKINNLTVFCGSKPGNDPLFIQHATILGKKLVEEKITLIYGGGNKGIMGTLANSVLDNGGRAIGIMPKLLAVPEHAHPRLTQMIKVKDMHTRKRLLYQNCDAALVLAGGYGTMDELFELLTWNQLHIHNKKIFIVNSDGYFDHLILFIKKMESENFLYQPASDKLIIADSPDTINFNI